MTCSKCILCGQVYHKDYVDRCMEHKVETSAEEIAQLKSSYAALQRRYCNTVSALAIDKDRPWRTPQVQAVLEGWDVFDKPETEPIEELAVRVKEVRGAYVKGQEETSGKA